MSRFPILLCILLITLSPFDAFSADEGVELTILSYNIHHGQGTDGKLDLPRIAKIIKDSKAQLVALQEVDVNTKRVAGTNVAAELGKLTGLQAQFGKAMDYQGGMYGQAILSAFPIKQFATHLLPQREGREPRIAIECTVEVPGLKKPLVFISVHLDHQIEEIRIDQVKKLNELFAGSDKYFVMAGDFNARPENKTMQLMLETWADSSSKSPAPTIPSDKPRSRIDYVLLRPTNLWETLDSKVLDEPVASDHRPLWVKLKERMQN